VANAESGIKTLADLKGKRISVGAAKSGTELNARAIFKAAGLSYADLAKVEYLPFGESVELMKNRQLDATCSRPAWAWPPSATWPPPSRSWWSPCRPRWWPRWVTRPTSQP
jgi:TRAP transporter TAXI family solute receptor